MTTPATRTTRPLPSIVSDDDTLYNDDSAMSEASLPTHVRFAATSTIYEIPTRSSFCDEERQKTWYHKEEYHAMKHSASETISFERSIGIQAGNQDYDMRGLEGRTREGFARVKQSRVHAVAAVIDEQDRQDEMGIADPVLLARIYTEQCAHSVYVAFVRGLFDAQELVQVPTSSTIGDLEACEMTAPRETLKQPNASQVPDQAVLLQMGLEVDDMEDVASRREAGFQLLVQDLDGTSDDVMDWSSAEAA